MSGEGLQLPATPIGEIEEGYRAFSLPTVYGDFLPMVEFRLRTGDRVGLAYAWLSSAKLEDGSISLTFTTGASVLIRGRNLHSLYVALVRHQAVSVHEADEPTALLVGESFPVVTALEVKG